MNHFIVHCFVSPTRCFISSAWEKIFVVIRFLYQCMNVVWQDEQVTEPPSPTTAAAMERTSAESPDKNDTRLQLQKVCLFSILVPFFKLPAVKLL